MELPRYVESVMQTLSGAGYRPYLVGGCVRDLLRGAPPSDYDLTSAALPETVMELFGAAAHPTGLPHGTVTVVSGGHPVEITTMRLDGIYRDNRHPESVRFTDRIEEDLARRDFTVNAMAMTCGGAVVDPFGGRKDLEKGVLRCVGDAHTRFGEDALRILRALRFASTLDFSIEEQTVRAADECRSLLRSVAHERVYAEMNKLLTGQGVTAVLLCFPQVLGEVIPEILPCVGFEQKNPHHCYDVWGHTARTVGAVPPERALRWTMLFHDLGKPFSMTVDEQGVGHFYGHTRVSAQIAGGIMERLHFEKTLRARISSQLACFDDMFPPERAAVHRETARVGREVMRGLLETKLADNAGKAPDQIGEKQRPWREAKRLYEALIAEGACCEIAELAVSGNDVKEIGFAGRDVGTVLERLLCEVAAEKLNNERGALLRRAERLYRSGFARKEG